MKTDATTAIISGDCRTDGLDRGWLPGENIQQTTKKTTR